MKIVLAYSGGLDTSVILAWLKERYDAELIAFCANIGQEEELKGLEAKAKKTGASKCYIVDLQEEFARDFIFPLFQAGALYENQYFLGTSIARPLIAKGMIEVARKERANALAHGATAPGHRSLARCTVSRPVPRTSRDDRVLRPKANPGPGFGQKTLLHGSQSSPYLL